MKRATDVPKAGKEVVLDATKLTAPEARLLVANYYQMQELRKRGDMQVRHVGDRDVVDKAPPAFLQYMADSAAMIEGQIRKGLEAYASNTQVGRWCMAQHGIGPVITAGLLAHLAIELPAEDLEGNPILDANGKPLLEPVQTVGHWWRFAGLDPSLKWEKGKKRPWNAALKQVCWHAGQCFKRVSGNEDAFYAQLYRQHKLVVVARNDAGLYAERAKTFRTNTPDVRKLLAEGKLPNSNLDAQACRWAVKMFLSHLHALWYWDYFGAPPPKPFEIAVKDHAHLIMPTRLDMFPGFAEAYWRDAKAA